MKRTEMHTFCVIPTKSPTQDDCVSSILFHVVNIGSISVTSPAAVTTTRSTPLNTPSVGVNETNSSE